MNEFETKALAYLERITKVFEDSYAILNTMVFDESRKLAAEIKEEKDFLERQELTLRAERIELEKLKLEKERESLIP